MQYKAIVFDMDGTLIDSEKLFQTAWLRAAQEAKVELNTEQYRKVIGVATCEEEETFKKSTNNPKFPYEELKVKVRGIVNELSKDGWPLKDGAALVLEYLRNKNIPMAVATNAIYEKAVLRLKSTGIIEYFSAICTSDLVPRGKPFPDVYELAIEKLGVDKNCCLAVEDSEIGAQSVISAGIPMVLVPDILEIPEDITKKSLAVYCSLEEIKTYFN